MEEMDSMKKRVKEYVITHAKRFFGAGFGLVVAILLLLLGFWRTLLIALCIGVGWYLGGIRDYKQWALNVVDRVTARRQGAAGLRGAARRPLQKKDENKRVLK